MSSRLEIEKITEEIQQECHKTVEGIFDSKKKAAQLLPRPISEVDFNVQDATNVFMYKKLAEFEYRLRQLERTKPNH